MRKKFYDLLSNRLPPKEAAELQRLIATRPEVRDEYEQCLAEFQSQQSKGHQGGLNAGFQKGFGNGRIPTRIIVLASLVIGFPCIFCTVLFFINPQILNNFMVNIAEVLYSAYGTVVIGFFLIYAIILLCRLQIRVSLSAFSIAFGFILIRTALSIYIVRDSTTLVERLFFLQSNQTVIPQGNNPLGMPKKSEKDPNKKDDYKFSSPKGKVDQTPDTQSELWTLDVNVKESGPVAQDVQGVVQSVAVSKAIPVVNSPTSTFVVNVDKYSYYNVQKFLQNHQLPPKELVRIEELINYFPNTTLWNSIMDSSPSTPFLTSFEAAPSPFHSDRYVLKIDIKTRETSAALSREPTTIFAVDSEIFVDQPEMFSSFQTALRSFVATLDNRDKIAIINYNGSPECPLPIASTINAPRINSSINELDVMSSSPDPIGLERAYAEAEQSKDPTRIFLVTDGSIYFRTPSFNEFLKLIDRKKRAQMNLSVIGFGVDPSLNHSMERIAQAGKGEFFPINTTSEGKETFAQKLFRSRDLIAKDVWAETSFNPAQVLEYRLIGYDSGKNKAASQSSKKNDGEIFSGTGTTVLYEVKLASNPSERKDAEELGSLKVHFKDSGLGDSRESSYPIEQSSIKSSLEQTSNDFRFAVAVAGFGEILKGNEFKSALTLPDIKKLALGSKDKDAFGYREEFIQLVENASQLMSGVSRH